MENKISERKDKILSYFKNNKSALLYLILGIITFIGVWIRALNYWLLQGYKYIPDVDSYLFLRYAQYIVDHGKLMLIDTFRYVPLGMNTAQDATLTAYVIAYIYKIFSLFISGFTVTEAAAWYPVIFFVLTVFVFFALVRRLFDKYTAILSTAFLIIVPAFLYRTMLGVAIKEALSFFLIVLSIYLYVVGIQTKNLKFKLFFSLLSGISTGFLALAWGGVGFVVFVIPTYYLVSLFINKQDNFDIVTYLFWLVPVIIFAGVITLRYGGISGILFNYIYDIAIFAYLVSLIDFVLFRWGKINVKHKLPNLPQPIISLLITTILLLIITPLIFGTSFFINQLGKLIIDILYPQGTTRFQLTVAYGQPTSFSNWLSASVFGLNYPFLDSLYILLFLCGIVLIFYNIFKLFTKNRWWYFSVSVILLFLMIFSDYFFSSGVAKNYFNLSLLGVFLLFIFSYVYSYYKDKESFDNLKHISMGGTITLLWFFTILITVKGEVRIFFLFAPVTVILAAYLLVNLIRYNFKLNNNYRMVIWVALIIIFYLIFSSFISTSYSMAKYTGLGYDPQWQAAEQWVKANTSVDSVFAHWWDYGYWVQTGFNRATVLDGGNYITYWDHLIARDVLTGSNVTEALEFLKTHKANYLLVHSSDIGKYPAYASIGSDANYDRLSNIPVFSLDTSQTQETRNETVYLYRGTFGLDDDLNYQGTILPRGNAAVAGVFLPLNTYNLSNIQPGQPVSVVISNNQQYRLTMGCVYMNNKEYDFANADIDSCLRIIPVINNNQMNQISAAYYISPKVKKTFFAQLYLLNNQNIPEFKLVYNDDKDVPLAIYNGQAIGPIRIWQINYPGYIKENPEFLKTDFPNQSLYQV